MLPPVTLSPYNTLRTTTQYIPPLYTARYTRSTSVHSANTLHRATTHVPPLSMSQDAAPCQQLSCCRWAYVLPLLGYLTTCARDGRGRLRDGYQSNGDWGIRTVCGGGKIALAGGNKKKNKDEKFLASGGKCVSLVVGRHLKYLEFWSIHGY